MDMSPLWISIKTACTATAVTFFLGLAAARWMTGYRGRLKGLIDGLFNLPLVLPPTVVGFFLLLMFGRYGPVGRLLYKLGTTLIFSWPATVIAAAVVSFPLMYKTSRGALEQIDYTLVSAARTLGVPEGRIFRKVVFPLAWPGIAAATVLTFARSLGEFGATLMIAGNIPGRTQTIPVAIFFAAEGGDMDKALLWVLLIVGISLIVILLMNYWTEHQRRFLSSLSKE